MTTSTLERIYAAAAEARAAGVAQASHRPAQRRCAEDRDARPVVAVRGAKLQLRAADTGTGLLHFSGFASVYNRGYDMWDMFGPYTEQVVSGAGAETLARADLDVPLVLQHDALRRIARTTAGDLTVDERTLDDVEGLYVDAPSLDENDADVAYIAPKLRAGLIDEMSFRFRITKGSWSPDWDEYHIESYDLHRGDVAIVAYGANPHTQGAGLRSLDDLTDTDAKRLEQRLHAGRKSDMSRAQLGAIVDMLRPDAAPQTPVRVRGRVTTARTQNDPRSPLRPVLMVAA